MIIREYFPSDKESVMEMVAEVLQNIFNGVPHQFKLLREFRVKKNYILFLVAVNDGEIIGTMALKKINSKTVRLKRMYVRSGHERKGVAQKLLDEVVNFAKNKGYEKMLLRTYPIMENANRFWKKNGFVETRGYDPEQIHVVKFLK
jgi:putative acetyltransferase